MSLCWKYIKSNKKNAITILLSITFSVALFLSILIIRDTDQNLDILTSRYQNEPYDVTIKDIDYEQSVKLANWESIEHLAFYRVYKFTSDSEKLQTSIVAANKDYILRQSRLKKGKLPVNNHQLVAEEWVLKQFGMDVSVGDKIKLRVKEPKGKKEIEQNFTLTGIITTNEYNKLNGLPELYTCLNMDTPGDIMYASIKFYNGTDANEDLKRIMKQYNFTEEQLNYDEDTFDLLDTVYHVSRQDILLLGILWIICGIVIYGVYRISIMSRMKQYGLLQAVGMKQNKIFRLIFQELILFYFISVILGSVLGVAFAYIINIISNSVETIFIFWGKRIVFSLQFPWKQMGFALILLAVNILFVACFSIRMIKRESILEQMNDGEFCKDYKRHHGITFSDKRRGISACQVITLKNITRDWKSSLFIILSIGIASSLFLVLQYNASLNRKMNKQESILAYRNGNYQLEEVNDLTTKTGIEESTVHSIKNLFGVSSVESMMIMPSKLIEDPEREKNKEYFDALNDMLKDTFYKSIYGNDGKDKVYKNTLKGYNQNALKKLHNYVIEGDYDWKNLSGEDAILFMPQTKKGIPVGKYIKNGDYIIDYKSGDDITIKFRKDLDVSQDSYWDLTDTQEEYTYCTFHIKAVVYYPYMANTSYIGGLAPDIIISEKQFRELTGIGAYTVVNINEEKGLTKSEKKQLENRILEISRQDKSVSARNITDEKKNENNMLNKDNIYKYGLAFLAYFIAILNVINNIKYRILNRKKELSIYRAIGINKKRLLQISGSEGIMYGLMSMVITMIFYILTSYLIYKQNFIKYSGYEIKFQLEYALLGIVSIINIVMCIVISTYELRKFMGKDIIELINDIE